MLPLALAAVMLSLPAAPVRAAGGPAALATPRVSGLPWRSGAKLGRCLASMRGRALDVGMNFVPNTRFGVMTWHTANSPWFREGAREAPLWVVGVPLLTLDTRGRFDLCADGRFDGYWRRIGADLASTGARGIVVRLGWEANLGSRTHPWGLDGPGQYPAYKACWRRAAKRIKEGAGHRAGRIAMEWTNAKRSRGLPGSPLDAYPGDDVVDLWGVHYYDTDPKKRTQAIWDRSYAATENGGPWGLGAWLAAAKAHGKRLAVSEWGVWRQRDETAAVADDPVYVENMHRFFEANAPDVAYETYLNSERWHALCPATAFPRAAARYRALWGRGGR